jgi:hypothetical protein
VGLLLNYLRDVSSAATQYGWDEPSLSVPENVMAMIQKEEVHQKANPWNYRYAPTEIDVRIAVDASDDGWGACQLSDSGNIVGPVVSSVWEGKRSFGRQLPHFCEGGISGL